MAAKEVKFSDDARHRMVAGVNILARCAHPWIGGCRGGMVKVDPVPCHAGVTGWCSHWSIR